MDTPAQPTRRQIYEMVWKEPVEDVAKRYGISGRGLGKLCDRHSIPVPPRGYWQKRSAGQKLKRPPLLEMAGSDYSVIELTVRTPPGPQMATAEAKPSLYSDLYARKLQEVGSIRVPSQTRRWHPVVKAAREKEAGAFWPRPDKLQSRRWAILNALSLHCEAIGLRSRIDTSNGMAVAHRTVSIEASLIERIHQYRRPLTEEERQTAWNPNQKWRQIKEPTGQLQFSILLDLGEGVPTRWADEDDNPLEIQLGEIIAAILVSVAYQVDRDEERQDRARKEHEERQRLEAERIERERETKRRERLLNDVERWHEANALRRYIAEVQRMVEEGRPPHLSKPLAEWVAWASEVADSLDPLQAMPD